MVDVAHGRGLVVRLAVVNAGVLVLGEDVRVFGRPEKVNDV